MVDKVKPKEKYLDIKSLDMKGMIIFIKQNPLYISDVTGIVSRRSINSSQKKNTMLLFNDQ